MAATSAVLEQVTDGVLFGVIVIVMFPFPSTVVSNVNPVPLPPVVETLEAELNPPTPPDNVPKFRVETPPRLGLVIVKVSPIR